VVFLWLLAGLVLLYFWLLGHWFARVTAFLLRWLRVSAFP
jgi:hypothetical protein